MRDCDQIQTKVYEQSGKCGESMERFVLQISEQSLQGNRECHCGGLSKFASHFNFDPAFSVNITDVSLEAAYDIGVYMVGGTEILNAVFRVNIYQHGGTGKLGLFSLVNKC